MREETRTRSHEAKIDVKIRRCSLKKSHGRVIETGKRCFLLLQTKKKKEFTGRCSQAHPEQASAQVNDCEFGNIQFLVSNIDFYLENRSDKRKCISNTTTDNGNNKITESNTIQYI